jgi:hypothetical protein
MGASMRPEWFDYEGAKAAGLTDAEIDAYIAKASASPSRMDRLSPVAQRSSTATAQMDPNTPTGRTLGGEIKPIARQVAQGASFGAADELEAAVRAPFSDRTYGDLRDDIRGQNRAFAEENPKTAIGAQLAGGLLTGGAAMRAFGMAGAAAPTAMGRIAQGAKAGAAGGGFAGTASSEGDFLDRIKSGAKGAAGGALAGTAIAGGVEAFRAATPIMRDIMNRVTTKGNTGERARRMAAQELADDGLLDPKVLQQVRDELDDMLPSRRVSLADVGGDNTRRLANTATLTPSENAGALRTELAGRQVGAGRQARTALRSGTGADGRPVVQMTDELTAARAQTTGPMYEAAKVGALPGDKVEPLTRSKLLRNAYQRAQALADEEGIALPAWEQLKSSVKQSASPILNAQGGAAQTVTTTPAANVPGEIGHFWKLGLDDEIAALSAKTGKGGTASNQLRQAQQRKQQLLAVMDESLPGYQQARGEYEQFSRQIDGVRQGARGDASRGLRSFPNADAADVEYLLKDAPDAVRVAYAKGAAAATERVVKNTKTQPAFFRAVLSDPEEQRKVRALFPKGDSGDDAFNYWLRETERDFRERLTENAVLGNSSTAMRQSAKEKFGDEVAKTARDASQKGVANTVLDKGFEWYQRQRIGEAANDVAGMFRPRSPSELQEMIDRLGAYHSQRMVAPRPRPTLGPVRAAAGSGLLLGRGAGSAITDGR